MYTGVFQGDSSLRWRRLAKLPGGFLDAVDSQFNETAWGNGNRPPLMLEIDS